MSDLPPKIVSPHHNRGMLCCHRFWAVLAVVALCAVAAVAAVDWLSSGPAYNSAAVAVSLPPSGGATASLPSVAPAAGTPDTGANTANTNPQPSPGATSNAPGTQTAMV